MDVKLTLGHVFDVLNDVSSLSIEKLQSNLLSLIVLIALPLWLILKQYSFPDPKEVDCIGSSNPLLYWYHALEYACNPRGVLNRANKLRYPTAKISTTSGWLVAASKSVTIEALKKVPESLSLHGPAWQAPPTFFSGELEWILGGLYKDEDVVTEYRETMASLVAQVTRNMDGLLPRLRQEIAEGLAQAAGSQHGEHGFTSIPALDLALSATSRLVDIGLFGQEICDNLDYSKIRDASNFVVRVDAFSKLLGRIAHRFVLVWHAQPIRRLIISQGKASTTGKYLGTLFDMDTKTFSLKSQLMTARCLLTLRTFAVQKLCQNISQLIQHSTTLDPLTREDIEEEVETAIHAHNWSTTALGNMPLADSLVKESMRLGNVDGYAFYRTFPHWCRIPGIKGRIPGRVPIAVPTRFVHLDPHRYPSPHLFIPNRFMDLRVLDTSDSSPKHKLETTSADFLAWGHGARACPGRFFGGRIMKLVVAVLISEGWDVRDGKVTGKFTGRKTVELKKRE